MTEEPEPAPFLGEASQLLPRGCPQRQALSIHRPGLPKAAGPAQVASPLALGAGSRKEGERQRGRCVCTVCVRVWCVHTCVHRGGECICGGAPRFFHLKANSNPKARPRRFPSPQLFYRGSCKLFL